MLSKYPTNDITIVTDTAKIRQLSVALGSPFMEHLKCSDKLYYSTNVFGNFSVTLFYGEGTFQMLIIGKDLTDENRALFELMYGEGYNLDAILKKSEEIIEKTVNKYFDCRGFSYS